MQIFHIFVGISALFLVVRLFFLPLAHRSVSSNFQVRPHKIALVAAIQTLSNLLFWLAMSAGVTESAVYYFEQFHPRDLSEAESALKTVRQWTKWLGTISSSVAVFGAIAAAFGLLWLSYLRTRQVEAESLDSRIKAKLAALDIEAQQGVLEPLPSTEVMLDIEREIASQTASLEELSGDSASQEKKETLIAMITHLQFLLHKLDLGRRAQSYVETEIQESDNQIRSSRLATFFVSDGFYNTLGAFGKSLAILCMLAIIPGSLVLTGPLALERLDEKRIALEMERRDFQFAIAMGEVNQAWEGLTQASEVNALTEEDEQTADALGQFFETQAIPKSLLPSSPRLAGQAVVRSYRLESVRSAILSSTAARSPTLSVAGTAQPAESPLTKQTKALLSRAADGSGAPHTALGQQVRDDALTIAKRNPDIWAGIKRNFQAYRASFGTTASPGRLQAIIVNQVVGDILGAGGQGEAFWVNQARNFGAKISAEAAGVYSEAAARAFLTDFAKSGDLVASANKAAARSVTALPSADVDALRRAVGLVPDEPKLQRAIRAQRASLTAQSLSISDTAATRAVKRAAGKASSKMNAAGMLVEFADFFPGFEGQDLNTKRARAARTADLNGPRPSRAQAKLADLQKSRIAVTRARSFRRLRGFTRIGGVLIGREAETGDNLVVDHFAWQVRNGTFSFDLAVEGQPAKSFGPYDAAIAHLALAYAADGRATTVTMVTAEPMRELRILTHPTLIDSGLGCRARRLDQFVSEITNKNLLLKLLRFFETQAAEGEVALYNRARDVQLYTLAETVPIETLAETVPIETLAETVLIETLAETVPVKIQSATHFISKLADEARKSAATLRHADAAMFRLADKAAPLVIAEKKEYFDAAITGHVQACRSANDLEAFSACVEERTKSQASGRSSHGSTWFSPMVEFQIWSGVRERPFSVDSQLSFLGSTDDTRLGPLRFMVQLAISSPAFFADTSKNRYDKGNKAVQNFVDAEPWEFKRLEPGLNKAIAELLERSTEHAEIYQDMLEFTTLQRFFRVALDGPLSETFPIEELPKIADVTLGAVNSDAPTLRWNVRTGEIEKRMLELLTNAGNSDESLQACIELAKGHDAARASSASWNFACGPSVINDALSEDSQRVAQNLNDLRVLRFELGVTRDDELAKQYSDSGCPKP